MWIGGPLTKIQKLSLMSFVYHGHSVDLFLYDLGLEVPSGVNKVDAREILNEESAFIANNSYAPFSDLFRYKMIQKTGLVWTDIDNVCLSDDWSDLGDIYAGYELQGESTPIVNNAILSLSKESDIVKFLVDESERFDKNNIVWGEIGPTLVTHAFSLFGYQEYIKDFNIFYPIAFYDYDILWNPEKKNECLDKVKDSKCFSIYNSMAQRSEVDRNNFPENSALNYFYNIFSKNK